MAIIDRTPPLDPRSEHIQAAHEALLADEAALDLIARTRGWTRSAVETLGLGWHDERLIIPIRRADGELCGYSSYQPDVAQRELDGLPKMMASRGIRRDLFPAPESLDHAKPIVVCEGEPDAITLWSVGIQAVAIPGTSAWRDDYADRLAAFPRVTIVHDADQVGRKLAARIVEALDGNVAALHVLDPAPGDDDGYDISDEYRRAVLADPETAGTLVRALIEHAPLAHEPAIPISIDDFPDAYAWKLKRWSAMRDEPAPPPEILGLFYRASVNGLHGEPGHGKSLIAHAAADFELSRGGVVVWLDYEQGESMTKARQRLVSPELNGELHDGFVYAYDPPRLPDGHERDQLLAAIKNLNPSLIIIDALAGCFAAHGLKTSDNDDCALWEAIVAKPLISTGAAILFLDHVAKDQETRGRWGIGAQRKLGLITGSAFTVELVESFAIGKTGRVKLVTAKDRHGHYPVNSSAAVVTIAGTDERIDLAWRMRADAQDEVHDAGQPSHMRSSFRPTYLMERVSRYLEAAVTPRSLTAIKTDNKGKDAALTIATEMLAEEGYVRIEDGPRNSRMVSLTMAYREEEDPHSDKYTATHTTPHDDYTPHTTPREPDDSPYDLPPLTPPPATPMEALRDLQSDADDGSTVGGQGSTLAYPATPARPLPDPCPTPAPPGHHQENDPCPIHTLRPPLGGDGDSGRGQIPREAAESEEEKRDPCPPRPLPDPKTAAAPAIEPLAGPPCLTCGATMLHIDGINYCPTCDHDAR